MKKKLVVMFIISHLFASSAIKLYARDEELSRECHRLYTRYGIDPITKSYKGWLRVCNNDKIHLYTKNLFLEKEDKVSVCKCFTDDYKTRDVEIIRSGE